MARKTKKITVPVAKAVPRFPAWARVDGPETPSPEAFAAAVQADWDAAAWHCTELDGHLYHVRVFSDLPFGMPTWRLKVTRYRPDQHDALAWRIEPSSTAERERLQPAYLLSQQRLPWEELAWRYTAVLADPDVLRAPSFPEFVHVFRPATVADLFPGCTLEHLAKLR